MFSYEVALDYWEVFLLILVRVASFAYTAPFFNTSNTPNRVKIGLSFFISIIIFTLIPERSVVYDGVLDYAILVIKESIVGLLLGFVSNISIQAISFAGHIIDINIGLSMSTMYDPTLREQTSVSGSLYYYVIFLILLVSGLHQFIVSAIIQSYTVIPLNGLNINLTLYDSFLEVIAEYFIIGFIIAMPVFIALMVLNVVLGILTKVASQLNMFSIGIQIKLILGLAVMYFTVSFMPYYASYIMDMIKTAIRAIAGGLT